MENWDKINAVQRMQNYILLHIDEEITLENLSSASGYSLWHSVRMFKELMKASPFKYIRCLKLTKSAEQLRDTKSRVIEVAFDASYDSHDGFTKAFRKQFGITPNKYQRNKTPICFFMFYPISHYYYLSDNQRSENNMEKAVSQIVTVQAVERPARKLIVLRSEKATDYMSYCEEMGCDWEGFMNSIAEKLDVAALLELPENLTKKGTSQVVAGVEVPSEFTKELPDDYEILELPPCKMLYFRGMPFEDDNDFVKAIEIVQASIEAYNPEAYGYQWALEDAPKFNFGASSEVGAKMAVPCQ